MNIGRTKIVETKDAVGDFLACFAALFPHGDFFTLNVSSPNTPNLRDLQEKSLLRELLSAVQEKNRELSARANSTMKPVFVKIAPDMEFSQVDEIIDVVEQVNLTGIVATNASAFMRSGIEIAERPRARWLERPADHGDGDEIYRAHLSNYPRALADHRRRRNIHRSRRL